MMDKKSNNKVYYDDWKVTEIERFTDEDARCYIGAEVVLCDYGKSMCLTMTDGHKQYIPLSKFSQLKVGDKPNMDNLQVLTLQRAGECCIKIEEINLVHEQKVEKHKFNIRPACPGEEGLILEFIKRLAIYEKCANEVVANKATLHHSLFVERSAEVVFAEEDGVVIGFALFFHNFSTFVGRKGLYLEDLFIIPEKRGRGYGKAMLKYLANLAVERNCGRMEWICLDWNKPALNVYRSIGAIPMDEWTVQRLTEPVLKQFAKGE